MGNWEKWNHKWTSMNANGKTNEQINGCVALTFIVEKWKKNSQMSQTDTDGETIEQIAR